MTILSHASADLMAAIEGNLQPEEFQQRFAPYQSVLLQELNSIKQVSREIDHDTSEDQLELAQRLIASAQALQAHGELLEQSVSAAAMQSGASNAVKSAAAWITGTLMPWLKKLWSSVWAVVQQLVKPTGWKIKGGIGSGVLGLANAEIEITFG